MRISSATASFLLAAGLGACATSAPTVDLDPVAAVPDSPPLWWFADNWGPFDATLSEPDEDGIQPMMLVDGVQVPRGSEALRSLTEEMLDPDVLESVEVRVYKHRCDKELFGPAAAGGIIMIFTGGYDGPVPGRRAGHPIGPENTHPRDEVCHRESP